jgi:hypothetical protein
MRTIAGLAGLLVVTFTAAASGEERPTAIDGGRAARLHRLAGEILPARSSGHPERRRGGRSLVSALDALEASIARIEARPSDAGLQELRSRRRGAEASLTRLLGRMQARGASESADELGRLFSPLWGEIDGALIATPSQRSQRLAEARKLLAEARSHSANAHGMEFVSLPLAEHR